MVRRAKEKNRKTRKRGYNVWVRKKLGDVFFIKDPHRFPPPIKSSHTQDQGSPNFFCK